MNQCLWMTAIEVRKQWNALGRPVAVDLSVIRSRRSEKREVTAESRQTASFTQSLLSLSPLSQISLCRFRSVGKHCRSRRSGAANEVSAAKASDVPIGQSVVLCAARGWDFRTKRGGCRRMGSSAESAQTIGLSHEPSSEKKASAAVFHDRRSLQHQQGDLNSEISDARSGNWLTSWGYGRTDHGFRPWTSSVP